MTRIARMVVPSACYVGISLARRDNKRKVKIPKIRSGIPRIIPRITRKFTIYDLRLRRERSVERLKKLVNLKL